MATVRTLVAWLDGRRRAILLLLLVWVVVTAAAAGAAADSNSWLGLPPLDWLTFVLFGLMAVSTLVVMSSMIFVRRQGPKQGPKRRQILPLLILIGVAIALGQRTPSDVGDLGSLVEEEESAPVAEQTEDGPVERPVGADDLGLVVAILAVAAIVLVWSRRRVGTPPPPDDEAGAGGHALAPAVATAADHLLHDDDPRTAVLLAYAALESALRDLGRAREPTETAAEHLGRVMRSLAVEPAAFVRLAELYEVARFSDHAVTVQEQMAAGTSLRQVQRQLAVLA